MSPSLREQYESSPFSSAQAPYLEALFERFLGDPASVAAEWRAFFERLGTGATNAVWPVRSQPPAPLRRGQPAAMSAPRAALAPSGDAEKQAAVSRLIQIYANRGHLIADIDPLGLLERPVPRVLELSYFGLSDADLETEFYTASRSNAVEAQMKLREILAQLRRIYGGHIGAEFAHVSRSEERLWLQDRFQDGRLTHRFTKEEQLKLLWQLSAAEGLERYLHTKYVGQKRFSLEGGESLIPLLDDLVQRCGASGVEDIVIAMAHRGRLNVLVNVLGKAPSSLFSEFAGHVDLAVLKGSGDVKYHKGFSADLRTARGNVGQQVGARGVRQGFVGGNAILDEARGCVLQNRIHERAGA
ncbi:MAG: hypothetical protein E4H01_08115, partial [Lysobacterales bacterium]